MLTLYICDYWWTTYNLCSDHDDDEVLLLESDVGPPLETGFANVVIVDNLPIIPVEKFERLKSVVRAIYGQIGTIKEGGLWIPILYTTYGYCFIEYATPQVGILVPDLSFL